MFKQHRRGDQEKVYDNSPPEKQTESHLHYGHSYDGRSYNIQVFEDALHVATTQYPYTNNYESINKIASLPSFVERKFKVHITQNDCAIDVPRGRKGILVNSASAKRPGGGVRTGACAQEEELCKRSNLIMGLDKLDSDLHYPIHKKTIGVYFPDVTFFNKGKEFDYDPEEVPFTTDVVALFSQPVDKIGEDATYDYHCCAFQPLIHFANKYQATYIVIPPVGCGVFRNDPNEVSKALLKVLGSFQLETVTDIYISCYTGEENYDAFRWCFRKWL